VTTVAPQVEPTTISRRPLLAGRAGLLVRPVVIVVALLALWAWVSSKDLDKIERRTLSRSEILRQLGEHVQLSLLSTVITVALAVPLGILLNRRGARWARPLALGLGNVGQAIPSIGLIVLLALVIGTGFKTALIALVAYTTLPVLRNTLTGLEGVGPALIEAARGMGMSPRTVLLKVQLPLAVPVILAGIRTALVLTVASAVLATFIGAGGLGDGLVVGVGQNRPTLSVAFGVMVAALALFADWLGLVAEEVLRPRGM
jgi:ABC-type proline/glycine betaine transport system permease subunit